MVTDHQRVSIKYSIADIEGHNMLGLSYLVVLEHLSKVFIARVLIEPSSSAR